LLSTATPSSIPTIKRHGSQPRVAIACSWLNQYGGAERVLETLHEMYPDAPIYTSMYEPRAMPDFYRTWDIRTSFLQRLPLSRSRHQLFLSLYPLAFEQFDLGEYDVVINNSSAFSYGVITRPETHHVCYCLTPARFLWNYHDYARRENLGRGARLALAPLLTSLRQWDVQAARRVDSFIAISKLVEARIAKYYGRRSEIIYPSIDTNRFAPDADGQADDYFLVVSRLVPYKRIDLAIKACNKLGLPLKIVGGGRDREALQRLAGPTVEFLGRVSDAEIKRLYSRCRAFIFAGEEDFGLTPLEAQASGRPVVAYGAGGALETIVDGQTGLFFDEPTVDSLAEVLASFPRSGWDGRAIRANAERFDNSVFKRQLASFVDRALAAGHLARAEGSVRVEAQDVGGIG
jgi:glycosyltransferase involved in cell wall biosynthesis